MGLSKPRGREDKRKGGWGGTQREDGRMRGWEDGRTGQEDGRMRGQEDRRMGGTTRGREEERTGGQEDVSER